MTTKWRRTVEAAEEWKLLDRPDESLWRGDMIRLADNPALGPGGGAVEMMLYELWGYDDRLGLMILEGYKAGMPMLYFPPESQGDGLTLESRWLIKNWDKWMCYFNVLDAQERPIPLPIAQTVIIRRPQHIPDLDI